MRSWDALGRMWPTGDPAPLFAHICSTVFSSGAPRYKKHKEVLQRVQQRTQR